MVDFDEYFSDVVTGVVNFEGCPVLAMQRLTSDPAAWTAPFHNGEFDETCG